MNSINTKKKEILISEHIPEGIFGGDMPGDKLLISKQHIAKASKLLPYIFESICQKQEKEKTKIVISIFGGSGAGKSEIASLLAFFLRENGINTYVLSGDNYPLRTPYFNDAERLRIYRYSGIKTLIKNDMYKESNRMLLEDLWLRCLDADPLLRERHDFLLCYQMGARIGLKQYLGSKKEIDFDLVNSVIADFKNRKEKIYLKRMGRLETDVYFQEIDFSDTEVMIVEWTHGNSNLLEGADIKVMINSTPEATQQHRRDRNRDNNTDSPFTNVVLAIEQELLDDQKNFADFIIDSNKIIVNDVDC